MSGHIFNFAIFLSLASLDYALSVDCPKYITISSRKAATVANNADWKDKLGSYSIKKSIKGNNVYENIDQPGLYLHKSKGGKWMVGDKLGKDFGWIANSDCQSECPTSCSEGSWIYWHGETGGQGVWKSDSTLMVDGCVKWRQTGECSAEGPREIGSDKDCNVEIQWKSGFCECTNGRKEMSKGCERPHYYGYEFTTCDEACANRGNEANDLLYTELMQGDQPYDLTYGVPAVNRQQIYQENGRSHWTCSSVSVQHYMTLEEANTACSNDQQCSFILDEGCDQKGAFKLCTAMSMVLPSSTDCLFNKERN